MRLFSSLKKTYETANRTSFKSNELLIMSSFFYLTLKNGRRRKKKLPRRLFISLREHALHADNFLNAITSLFCLNLRIRDIRYLFVYSHSIINVPCVSMGACCESVARFFFCYLFSCFYSSVQGCIRMAIKRKKT